MTCAHQTSNLVALRVGPEYWVAQVQAVTNFIQIVLQNTNDERCHLNRLLLVVFTSRARIIIQIHDPATCVNLSPWTYINFSAFNRFLKKVNLIRAVKKVV